MSDWISVGHVTDIPSLGARVVRFGTRRIAVFRTADDEIFAVDDSCPHKQGPLSQGIVHGRRVTCPLHNWVIELADGQAVAPDEGCVHAYPTKVEDGVIQLQLDQSSAPVTRVAELQTQAGAGD